MSFTFAFYQHIMFRHSCGVCHYCNTRRPSDITLADFWGWEKTNPQANADDKGLSLILVNTEKGAALFEAVKDQLDYFPAELEDVLQPNLQHPSVIHPQRMEFEKDYIGHGFEHACKKFCLIGFKYDIKIIKKRIINKLRAVKRKLLYRN